MIYISNFHLSFHLIFYILFNFKVKIFLNFKESGLSSFKMKKVPWKYQESGEIEVILSNSKMTPLDKMISIWCEQFS